MNLILLKLLLLTYVHEAPWPSWQYEERRCNDVANSLRIEYFHSKKVVIVIALGDVTVVAQALN